jgi:hypothetical protein
MNYSVHPIELSTVNSTSPSARFASDIFSRPLASNHSVVLNSKSLTPVLSATSSLPEDRLFKRYLTRDIVPFPDTTATSAVAHMTVARSRVRPAGIAYSQ